MRIVLGYPASTAHVAAIQAAAGDARIDLAEPAALDGALLDADIFCGHARLPVDWPRVVQRGRLQWIQSSAAGLDHCLHPAVIESTLLVSSASGVFADSVAEQAMALLLGLIRRIHLFLPAWQRREFQRLPTDDLTGKTIGIVGLGGNGSRIAEVLAPWRCRIVATDYFEIPSPPGVSQVWPADQLDSLLASAEVLILTAPLTPSTRGMISTRELSVLNPGSYLINVGRGPLVDEPALVEALQTGRLAGAGLDVTYQEPPPADSRLWTAPRLLVTPHVGAQSARRLDRVTELFCENLRRFRAGQPLINAVNKRLGFPEPADRWRPRLETCAGP
jgi:D-3-phosphoglycerate dehydrogenase